MQADVRIGPKYKNKNVFLYILHLHTYIHISLMDTRKLISICDGSVIHAQFGPSFCPLGMIRVLRHTAQVEDIYRF
jgi:hypothetical protein